MRLLMFRLFVVPTGSMLCLLFVVKSATFVYSCIRHLPIDAAANVTAQFAGAGWGLMIRTSTLAWGTFCCACRL